MISRSMRSFDAPCTPSDAMTASVSLLNSPARAAVVSRVDGDSGTPRRAEAPSLVLLGDARRRGVFVFFQDRGKIHGLLAEQGRPAVARVALRLAAVVRGRCAQVPQNALNDATVTAAVSHQRLRPVRARDARRENATRLALLGEAPQGARAQRCGGVPCEKHACSSSDDLYG